MKLTIALLLGFAVWLIDSRPSLARLRPVELAKRPKPPIWLLCGAGLIIAAFSVQSPQWSALTAGAWSSIVLGLVLHHHRRAKQRLKVRQKVAGACGYLAGLLRIGMIPTSALIYAARRLPILVKVAHTAELGGSVSEAFLVASRNDGAAGFQHLARAWTLAEHTGASLVSTLTAVVTDLDQRLQVDEMVDTELAAPRATGQVLALLPFVGLAFGFGFGGNPLTFLLDNMIGRICFLLGVGLAGVGLLWSESLASKAAIQ